MSSRGFLGAGDLYIGRWDSATSAFLNYEGPFLANKFEIKPNSDLKEMPSRGKTTYGQVIESVPLPKPTGLTVDLSEVDRVALAMALFGTATVLNQGSGTITAESINADLGKWVQLSKGNLATAGLSVTNAGATTTYVLGADYEINYRLGMIRCLASGDITADQALKVTATYNAITGSSIAGATQSQVRARFKLDGKNFADDAPVVVLVREAVLTPDNAFDFLADKFAEISLKGTMKTPVGATEPFVVELHDA